MTGSASSAAHAGEWNDASHNSMQTSRDTTALNYFYLAGRRVTVGVLAERATNMKRVDIAVSAAAGLAVAFPLYKIFLLPEMCESPRLTHDEAVATLVALASYLSVPLLLGLLQGRRFTRYVWLWTPVLGSMFCAAALFLLPLRREAWDSGRFVLVWLALSVWTLPFAAAVNYSGMIVRGIRRWHEGPKEHLSISPR